MTPIYYYARRKWEGGQREELAISFSHIIVVVIISLAQLEINACMIKRKCEKINSIIIWYVSSCSLLRGDSNNKRTWCSSSGRVVVGGREKDSSVPLRLLIGLHFYCCRWVMSRSTDTTYYNSTISYSFSAIQLQDHIPTIRRGNVNGTKKGKWLTGKNEKISFANWLQKYFTFNFVKSELRYSWRCSWRTHVWNDPVTEFKICILLFFASNSII